jgi:transposase
VDELYRQRVAGIDVGATDVKVSVRLPGPGRGRRVQQTRTFGTTTTQLLALRDWLDQQRVQLVGMESTGVYWKPVFYALEDVFTCWLLNPLHVKKVPGRKTDVTDAQWIARLVEGGLVAPSFVPPPIRELRDLTRYRTALVHDRVRNVQRLHDVLEDAGVMLAQVVTDITGRTGRRIMAALIGGERDGRVLADLAAGTLQRKRDELAEVLPGRFNKHHAIMVGMMLRHIDELDGDIADVEMAIAGHLFPFGGQIAKLRTIPGFGEHAAPALLAEIGADMSRFETAAHLSSWAGVCPGNNESAGRHLGGAARPGNPHLKAVLFEAACVAIRTKDSYLHEFYQRMAARRGRKRALVAVSRKLLEIAWWVLSTGVDYHDLGPDFLARRRNPERRARYLLRELRRIGYDATITPAPAA